MRGEKPIWFTEHAVKRLLALNLTEEDAVKAITEGKRTAEGKVKFKALIRTKKGFIIVTCAQYPDHIKVITVSRRR